MAVGLNKLKNTDSIKQMLDGTHRTQTRTKVGWDNTTAYMQHEIGDTWPELDTSGNIVCIWEQKKGYKIKHPPNYKAFEGLTDYLNEYPNCFGVDCKTRVKTRLDQKFRVRTGMCSECVAKMETKLKIQGKFKEYEKDKLKKNAEAFFKSTDIEIELLANSIASGSGVAHSDGTIEQWLGNTGQANNILQEYNEYKNIVLRRLDEY